MPRRPYVSPVCRRRTVPRFDDATDPLVHSEQLDRGFREGYIPRDFADNPAGSHECARLVTIDQLVPEPERKERIEERERTNQTNLALRETYQLACLHQGHTSSCWANAVVDDMHMTQLRNGTPLIKLSPASIVGRVKNFRDRGGNCTEALECACSAGVVSQQLWPPNEPTGREFFTEEARADAARHIVLEYWDLAHRAWDQLLSILLCGFTCAYGNWSMSHAVNAIDPVIDERGEIGLLVANSGAYRGPDGLNLFFGERAQPDDACSVRAMEIYVPQKG